jgi:hypothetical protein
MTFVATRSEGAWVEKRETIFVFGFAVTHWKAPIRPNKSKELQAFLFGFPWIYLALGNASCTK